MISSQVVSRGPRRPEMFKVLGNFSHTMKFDKFSAPLNFADFFDADLLGKGAYGQGLR